MTAPRSRRSLAALILLVACGDAQLPTALPHAEVRVTNIEVVSGAGQLMWSGRRSTAPFRVRALDSTGSPVSNAQIAFAVAGAGGGDPTQPHALTDQQGLAETWLLRTTSGAGAVVAQAGTARAELPFTVDRGAGDIRFLAGTGEVGLPGRPHPDSVLTVRVLDTEGRPLPNQEVWFAAPSALARSVDTTGADGTAGTRLGRTDLGAGNGDVWAFILNFPELLAHDVRPLAAPVSRVVLISVDGLRADALGRWNAPTLRRLASEGAAARRAVTVTPALTAPAHLSMLSGVRPEAHGIYSDVLDVTPQMATLDPVFRYATRQGRRATAYMSRGGPLGEFERALACRLAFGLDSLHLTAPEARLVVDAALPALADSTLDLVFLHFPDPDLAGHRKGWDSPDYGAAVAAVDAAVGRVVEAVDGERTGTLVVVTSDHGGGGAWGPYQHGSPSPEDMEIPLLLWGARVARSSIETASILDVAPTVLWALGIAPPPSYQGRVLMEAFK